MAPGGYSESQETGWKDLEKSLSQFFCLQARSARPKPLSDLSSRIPPAAILILLLLSMGAVNLVKQGKREKIEVSSSL